MSAWIVYSKDGLSERCVLRSLEYGGTHMGERAVTATFDSSSEVAFEVFDYIEYRGEKFELEAVPTVKKTSDFNYEYELRFVSLKYELERCEMRDLVPNDNGVVYPTPLTFTFTGDVRYLVERIQACLDDLYGKGVWSIIVADDVKSEEKNISIAQQNCWNALALVSTTYGLNFYVKGRTITIGGEQSLVGHTFEYGKGNGLYEIERAADTGTGIVTKLRAYGASRNLDYSYPKKPEWSDSVLPVSFALSPLRIMLPTFKTDGKTDYVLADEATIAKYGIREASMVYDDIYPTITGATYNGQAIDEIKAVDEVDETKNTFSIELYDLGFDLEEHLTTSDAQISMKTGTLQGYTFNISGIEKLSGGYKLTLGRNSLENSEESGAYVPSKNWNMAKGDKFVLLNILMPQAYIRDAENRLLARAKEYLAQYGKTNFSYNIGLHDKFLVEHPSVYGALVEGARLSVYDAELGISEDVTIQSITITENMEENILPQVKVTLNNEPSASTLDRIQGKLNEVAAETAANNFSSQSELMAQYRKKLDKPFFEKLFVAIDKNGNEIATNDVTTPVAYILAKYDFASVGGVTMYAEGGVLNIPSIYNGLPIDNETLYWEDVDGSRVLKARGGEGGGGLTEVYWDDVKMKPSFALVATSGKYADLSGLPDLKVYATTEYLTAELKKYVTLNTEQTIGAHKDFLNGLSIGGLGITKSQDDVIYLDANLVVRGGITMYAEGEVNIPSIIDSLPIASTTAKGIASFDGTYFAVDSNGKVTLLAANVGLNEEELAAYLTEKKYATQSWVYSLGYASSSDLNALQTKVNDFLEGSDTDTIINKWKELEYFLSGLSESDNLATILGTKANQSDLDDTNEIVATKWTQDDTKINNWDNAYKWGNHADAGYALKSYVDNEFKKYVTLADNQTISGVKTFTNGLKIGTSTINQSQNDVIYIDANLVVRGGITMYSDNTVDVGTIFDALPIDGNTIFWENGVLKANITEGVITNITSDMVVGALGFTPYNASNPKGYISGITSSMVVSALGYTPLQNHQTIYALTIQKNGTNVGTYTPNSAKKTINIVVPTKVSELDNDNEYATTSDLDSRIDALINGAPTAFDTLKEIADVLQGNVNSIGDIITTLGTKADKAIKISAGTGLSGGGTLEADRTLSLATSGVTAGTYKSVTVDKYGRVTSGTNPTTLAGYGITDAYTKTKVDELLGNYVTLATKQPITGEKNFTGGLKVNGSPIVYDATNKYWKLEGDLLVTGGVTMYASDSSFTPSTIMDAIATDNVNLKVVNGVLTFVGQIGGGVADSVLWDNIEGKPSWIGSSKPSYSYSEISGTPTLLSSFTNDLGFVDSSALDGYLPISGGTINGKLIITNKGNEKLILDTTESANYNLILFRKNGTNIGYIGIVNNEFRIKFENYPFYYNGYDVLHAGNISSYNAGSASKLTTARTIWGQSFDGTGNIDGLFTLLDTDRDSRPFKIGWLFYNERAALNMWSFNSSLGGFGDMCLGVSSNVVSEGSLYFNSSTKNWGIGTNSPSAKLDVNGSTQVRDQFRLLSTNGVYEGIIQLYSSGELALHSTKIGVDYTNLIINRHGGNVLIGTATDSGYRLDVNGNMRAKKNVKILSEDGAYDGQMYISNGNLAFESSQIGVKLNDICLNPNGGKSQGHVTINGIPIYKSQDDVLYIDGNLAVRGGITMYATDAIDVPSIIDALPIASASAKGIAAFNPNDFSVVDGYVSFIGKGGIDESVLANYAKKTDLSKYLPLSGGQMTGGIGYTLTPDSYPVGLPAAGTVDYANSWLSTLDNMRTFIGDAYNTSNSQWNYLLSIRHANGVSVNSHLFGMCMYTSLFYDDNLVWRKKIESGWQGERVILDSVNWKDYVTTGNVGISGNVLTVDGSDYRGGYPALRMHIPNVNWQQFMMRGDGIVELRHGDGGQSGTWGQLALGTIFLDDQRDDVLYFPGKEYFDNHGNMHIPNADGSWSWNIYNSNGSNVMTVYTNGNIISAGGITMYSDIRKKTKLQDVELTLQQIAEAPLIEHYYNSDENRTTHVGSIAQYWAGLNDWFCKLDNDGYYTMEIQNAALASAISVARHLQKYETKTDRKIRLLKQRVKELEDKIEKLENN